MSGDAKVETVERRRSVSFVEVEMPLSDFAFGKEQASMRIAMSGDTPSSWDASCTTPRPH